MGAERPDQGELDPEADFDLVLHKSGRYRLVGRLGAGGMGVVYEALDVERGVHVAVKTLHATNAQTLYRFKQEFRALAEIVHPRLVRLYELQSDGDRWYFSMELIEDGVSMLDWLRRETSVSHETIGHAQTFDSRPPPAQESSPTRVDSERRQMRRSPAEPPLPLERRVGHSAPPSYDRLRTAFAQLAEGVQVLHAAGKLHRDLKPENVFVRDASGQVVLLDFGLVAALEGHAAAMRPNSWPVSLAPDDLREEHGSQHDSAAYHATQAGVIAGTFAYMAPEQALAQPLTAAADWYAVGVMLYEALTGQLPYRGSAAQILMRKQSGAPVSPRARVPGTPEDLSELCMALLRGEPAERPTGLEVIASLGGSTDCVGNDDDDGRVPFIGRTQQLDTLRAAFAASQRALAVAHVHGRSGAGKSSLLQRFLGELRAQSDTLVLEGRCYEQEFIPYKAIDSLTDALTRHLLQLSEAEQRALLPDDAGVLMRIFPVIGRLFPASEPGPHEADDLHAVRRRAYAAMRELLARLAQKVRLVLFIDDLQWGDVDSATLLAEVLPAGQAPALLLVLSYRSEQHENVGLAALREASSQACTPEALFDVDVGSLAAADARQLATTLLGASCSEQALAWTLAQAAGSAFLIHELVRYLQSGGAPTEAVGRSLDDILWDRITALPSEQRELLTVAAIAGRPVRLRPLKLAAGLAVLAPAVVPSLCSQRLLRTQGTGSSAELETFHDRVRESILARTPSERITSSARALVRELELAEDADAETCAALHERAGDRGRASRQYAAAVRGAVAALAFEHAERLAHKAIALAESDEERALAYEAAVHFYTDMARYPEAYALTRRGVASLGVELPEKFVPPRLIADFLAAQVQLIGKRPGALRELPTMPAGRLQLAVRLANAGAKAAFQVRPELCVAVCTKLVRLCLAHGNSPDSAIGYMVFGTIFQGGILGRYATGYDFGQLALALVDKYQNERQRAEVSFVVGYFGISWLRPAREAEALWHTAFEAGRASGDLFHMGCAAAGRMMSYAMRGEELSQLESESTQLCQLLARNGLREQLAVVASARQLARDLRGRTAAPGRWQADDYDDERELTATSSFGARHFAHCCLLLRAQALYLHGQHEQAQAMLQRAAPFAPDSKGMLHAAEHTFLHALVTAAGGEPSPRQVLSLWRAQRELQARATRCAHNFAHKAALVRAELLRLRGRERAALTGYEEAGRLAARFGYTHVEGIAHQLAARLHAARGEHAEVGREQAAAHAAFERWGALTLQTSSAAARPPG